MIISLIVLVALLQAGLQARHWTIFTHFFIFGSILQYLGLLWMFTAMGSTASTFLTVPVSELHGTLAIVTSSTSFWMVVPMCVAVAMLPDLVALSLASSGSTLSSRADVRILTPQLELERENWAAGIGQAEPPPLAAPEKAPSGSLVPVVTYFTNTTTALSVVLVFVGAAVQHSSEDGSPPPAVAMVVAVSVVVSFTLLGVVMRCG